MLKYTFIMQDICKTIFVYTDVKNYIFMCKFAQLTIEKETYTIGLYKEQSSV